MFHDPELTHGRGANAQVSPSAHLLEELQLHGYRPLEEDGDARPLPSPEAAEQALTAIFEAATGLFTETRLEADLSDLLWGVTNLFHRQTERMGRLLDDNEMAQRNSQAQQDGSEVRSVELERLTSQGMELIRCPTCQVLRIPDENLVHDHVLPDPVGKLPLIMKALMSLRMMWLKPELPALTKQDVRIADIGCGDGQFLEFMSGIGYSNIFGIEPDSRRARNAQQRGVPVFDNREAAEAAGKFNGGVDLMFVWHVLEHVDTPAGFIAEYAKWLVPGGKMVLSVPNHASLQTRLFGYYAAYPDYGRHIWYHEPSYLDWMKRNSAGLKAEIMRDRNVEYEVFAWVDSIASSIVREQNFVHKALKKGNGGPGRKFAALLAALALLPVAAVLTPISLLTKRGSTLTFVLTRE